MNSRGIATVISLAIASLIGFPLRSALPHEPFTQRGYYITLMRMPVMGLAEWRQAVDCFAEDDINTLILWTAGGFRSKKFPITWKYNSDHANIQHDFVRDLIDYAHTKHIQVLLGFTPFGYDGANQYPLDHPELKARKADGSPVDPFGIQSIGWNLCPAQPESQRFMREYIREMFFDFYPNADGLLIESSDYAICHCPDCGPHFYDHEFDFVRAISNDVWQKKPDATILVFPHYFTGAKVPGLDAIAARQPFDPRWGLIFAPHSAHFDADLMQKAKTTVSWSDAPALHTPREVAAAARTARRNNATGFIPSLEAFSYIATAPEAGESWVVSKRHHPYGFDPLADGKMPYNTLPVRVQRFAYRTFSHDPDLDYAEFQKQLGEHFFGKDTPPTAATDLLELQRVWSYDCDWYWATPLLDPDFFAAHAKRLNWSAEKLAAYDHNLATLSDIASRYTHDTSPTPQEMSRLAATIVKRWDEKRSKPSDVGRHETVAP
ncbi:MAG TPA: hypothetical protein VHU84_08635 [Lacipirellulaceae bacterium]|nr:hypothetical protein [Lacipirellulaceae bacterium]